VWVVAGPLASGWARRAGTPETVLAASANSTSAVAAAPVPTTAPATAVPTTVGIPRFGSGGFSAKTKGTITQSAADASGQVTVKLIGDLTGGASGSLDIELRGTPVTGGGVSISSGTVAVSDGHSTYQGAVALLRDGQIVARMPGPGGSNWQVEVVLNQLDNAGGTMSGQVQATPASSSGGIGRGDDR
jgi:hypothetical protein